MIGVWHHQDRRRRGPRELTGIVDHSRGGSSHGAGPLPGTERTPSTINSKTPPASSMPFTSSSSLATLQVRCAARVQQDMTGHRARTGDPLYPGPQSFARLTHAGSPHVKRNDSVRPSWQMRRISVSTSPTTAPSKCARSSTKPYPPKADAWPLVSSSAYHLSHPRNRSPRGEPCASGRTHSTPTSTPAEPAMAPRKPSTDIIELGRCTARGYRNPTNYQLRMLLIAGGLDASTHTQL